VQVGSLVVDISSRVVSVRGQEVDMTTAEFDILHALASSAGRVLSIDQLLRRVHGKDWAAYDAPSTSMSAASVRRSKRIRGGRS
jgi:DNA-binding response OmpR family regulator